jgi:hypothetical protein
MASYVTLQLAWNFRHLITVFDTLTTGIQVSYPAQNMNVYRLMCVTVYVGGDWQIDLLSTRVHEIPNLRRNTSVVIWDDKISREQGKEREKQIKYKGLNWKIQQERIILIRYATTG